MGPGGIDTNGLPIALATGGLAMLACATGVAAMLARRGFPLSSRDDRPNCIDGLRGYLALSVMIHHFIVWIGLSRLGTFWTPPANNLANQLGGGAVALFFMVTGNLFYDKVRAGFARTDWIGLFVTRFWRISPMIVVSVIVVAGIISVRHTPVLDASFPGSVLAWTTTWDEPPLLGYADARIVNANVLWSLRWEWLFYLAILPTCAVFADAVRRREGETWMVPVALLGVALVGRVAGYLGGLSWDGFRYLPLFAIGMLTRELQDRDEVRRRLGGRWPAALALACLAIGMTISWYPYTIALPFYAVFFTIIVCGNDLGGVLRMRGARVLGDCSYGIYLLHGTLLYAAFTWGAGVLTRMPIAWLPVLLPVFGVAITLVTATTHVAIERPLTAMGKRLARALTGRRRLGLTTREIEVAP